MRFALGKALLSAYLLRPYSRSDGVCFSSNEQSLESTLASGSYNCTDCNEVDISASMMRGRRWPGSVVNTIAIESGRVLISPLHCRSSRADAPFELHGRKCKHAVGCGAA